MPRSLGNVIADSLGLSLGYAERLLRNVPAGRILHQIGHPAPAVPEHFEVRFSKDATCVDDPDLDLYPPLREVFEFFTEGHRMVSAALRSTPDEVLQQPNPAEGRMRDLFPTIGSVQAFYCGGHMMMHLGQMSAWRRMEGMPAA